MPRRARGAALIIFMIIVVLGSLVYLFGNVAPDQSNIRRERKTQEALAQARDALIGYALKYRESYPDRMYGYLPLPDLGTSRNNNVGCGLTNEGCDAGNFAGNGLYNSVIGRLPWRTLGIEPLRDGQGECLWYAVSGSHQRIQRVSPMNWDTLGHLDVVVADNSALLVSALANAHERPVVIIFSSGPTLPGQDRSASATDNIAVCGGNYDVKNYLDPSASAALGGKTNYLPADPGGKNATEVTGDADPSSQPPKSLSPRGKVFETGGNFLPNACQGANCNLLANDSGLELTGDGLFAAIRKHAYFRTDINSLLDRITDCLRDQVIPGGHNKIAGADANSCYGSGIVPLGYYPNYRDMIYVYGGSTTVNGSPGCAGALLFGSQRRTGQLRDSAANRGLPANYLESPNVLGPDYSGQELFERVSPTQTVSQDIVHCIPSTRSFDTSQSPGLSLAGLPQLANYNFSTRTLTLGQPVGSPLPATISNFLYGCAWRPEPHTLGSGLRSYFTFRILDGGFVAPPAAIEGFTFAIVDGDNNQVDLINHIHPCGAAAQHLGYSGNNTESPFIAQPKIAFEVDLQPETGFNASNPDHLLNGRNDPAVGTYTGGHVAIAYWGGETAINTTIPSIPSIPPCTPPAFEFGAGICYLPQEEDDNVHAQPAFARTGFPAPPQNPAVPATELAVPPDSPAGAYKLDPTLTSTPVSPNYFHVRAELTRTGYVRVATAVGENLNLNSPGATINSVNLYAGDRVWVRYQTVSSENGLYVWNGAATPMTRATDGESASNFSLPRVRVATTGNIDVSLPGDTIDSVYLFAGDRILVKNQAATAQNGVYIWQAANLPMNRADDANIAAELAGMVVEVQQGMQNARSIWRQNMTNLVVDTTALSWTNIRVKLAAPASTNIASPGAELDGIKMKVGDRVFVRNNGVYIWNGAAVPMTAAPDIVAGSSFVQILQGSEANAWWLINGAASQRSATVRVATRKPVGEPVPDWNNPGSQIDSVGMLVGDRVLVKDETDTSKNGIYIWNGAAVAMTRATDADAPGELAGALVQVLEGSDVGRAFRQTTLAATGVIDASPVQWSAIDRSTSYLLEIWILPDDITSASKIDAMKNTTRSMSLQYPTFTPHLQDRPVIPYPFRNARIGFTTGQGIAVNDQTISISDYFTTWLE